jgi:hypothetical protein
MKKIEFLIDSRRIWATGVYALHLKRDDPKIEQIIGWPSTLCGKEATRDLVALSRPLDEALANPYVVCGKCWEQPEWKRLVCDYVTSLIQRSNKQRRNFLRMRSKHRRQKSRKRP